MKYYADYHVHSDFSDDSVYKMEDVICDAISKNMNEICFTDHVDYGVKRDWEWGDIQWRNGNQPIANVDYPAYFSKIAEMQEKYGRQILIKAGMEFGIQSHTIPQFEALFQRYSYDFIILSIHQVGDLEFWTGEYQQGKSQKEYNDTYYDELYTVTKQYKNYSVLGHMDLIQRYDPEGFYPFENNKEIIVEILKQVISDGKGIEINTSSYRYGLPDLQPRRDILKLYQELGGNIITIGSDSHKKEHLGTYIGETITELKKMGFQYFCTFDKMNPVFHRI